MARAHAVSFKPKTVYHWPISWCRSARRLQKRGRPRGGLALAVVRMLGYFKRGYHGPEREMVLRVTPRVPAMASAVIRMKLLTHAELSSPITSRVGRTRDGTLEAGVRLAYLLEGGRDVFVVMGVVILLQGRHQAGVLGREVAGVLGGVLGG